MGINLEPPKKRLERTDSDKRDEEKVTFEHWEKADEKSHQYIIPIEMKEYYCKKMGQQRRHRMKNILFTKTDSSNTLRSAPKHIQTSFCPDAPILHPQFVSIAYAAHPNLIDMKILKPECCNTFNISNPTNEQEQLDTR